MKIYGLRIEIDQEEFLKDIILVLNKTMEDKCKLCILDHLDSIVKDYHILNNSVLLLQQVREKAALLSENAVSIRMRYYLDNKNLSDMNCYEDFAKSDCLLLLWGYDCYYYDIYCKDETLLLKIEADLKPKRGFAIEYISSIEHISKLL